MLKPIITHTICVVAGFVLSLLFTFISTSWFKVEDEKNLIDAQRVGSKENVTTKHRSETGVSNETTPKLINTPGKNQKNACSQKRVSVKARKESPLEDDSKKHDVIKTRHVDEQLQKQTEPSSNPKIPVCVSKTLKFKRQSKIKEIKLEGDLGMKEIFVRIEKEMELDNDTKVRKLLCRGKLLKEGFLESIAQGATVSVMVSKSKPAQTKPSKTKTATPKSPKMKDQGLDFLDSVLDGLKEPAKQEVKKSHSLIPTRQRSTGMASHKPMSKISISKQKRIHLDINKDIVLMEREGWTQRKYGLSRIYHQGLESQQVKR